MYCIILTILFVLRFVVSSHIRHHPSKKNEHTGNFEVQDDFTIKQEILKKYIVYARQNVHPKLQNMDKDKVANIYSQLRQESLVGFYIVLLLHFCRKLGEETCLNVVTIFKITLISGNWQPSNHSTTHRKHHTNGGSLRQNAFKRIRPRR